MLKGLALNAWCSPLHIEAALFQRGEAMMQFVRRCGAMPRMGLSCYALPLVGKGSGIRLLYCLATEAHAA